MATKCSDPSVLASLFLAAYSGNLADVKSALKNNALSADVADPEKGSTALLWASSGGSLEVVEWLVKEAGANAGHRNKDDRTAFFFACEHCHQPVANFLAGQTGVDVNAKDKPSGHTPLHRACIAGQTRDKKGSEELISWLLTSAKADAKATDLSGRMPGDADLKTEAPSLKARASAAGITKTLEDARSGGASSAPTAVAAGTRAAAPAAAAAAAVPAPVVAEPAAAPAAAPTSPSVRLLPKPSAFAAARPATTLASARAAAGKPASPTRSASPTSRVAMRAAALAEKTKPVGSSGASSSPAPAPAPTPAPAPVAAAVPAVTSSSAPVSSVRGKVSPSSSPAPAPAPVTRGPSSPQRVSSLLARKAAAAASPSRSRKPGSPKAKSPRSANSSPPWASKLPRDTGDSSPPAATGASAGASSSAKATGVTAGLVKQSSYRLRNATASSSSSSNGNGVSSASSSSPPSSSGSAAAATTIKPGLVKQSSYLLRTGSATSNGNGSTASSTPASSSSSKTVTATAASRFQRPGSSSTAPAPSTNSATGSAAAIIGASRGPKASALAAAFENKARGGAAAGTSTAPAAVQRGGAVISSSSSSSSSGGYSGSSSGGGNGVSLRPATKVASATAPVPARPMSPTREKVTPESLLGKGTVSQRKKVYVAAAQRSGNSNGAPAPFLGKGKKEKDGSFMDKFVSMFTISPQSSPASSPQRPASRSPNRPRQRSPMASKVANWAAAATSASSSSTPPVEEQPRMGFFSTNKSFKASVDAGQIENEKE
eukprot:g7472.t1